MQDLISKLEAYKSRDNFPVAGWDSRSLMPSDDDVRSGINSAVSEFADFLAAQLSAGVTAQTALQEKVQKYFDERDNDDFDTEEREYSVDVQCELAQVVGEAV